MPLRDRGQGTSAFQGADTAKFLLSCLQAAQGWVSPGPQGSLQKGGHSSSSATSGTWGL